MDKTHSDQTDQSNSFPPVAIKPRIIKEVRVGNNVAAI